MATLYLKNSLLKKLFLKRWVLTLGSRLLGTRRSSELSFVLGTGGYSGWRMLQASAYPAEIGDAHLYCLFRDCIDGFHCDVIKWKSQNSEILRILIYTRLKINKKWMFVQVLIPVACFISKIQQFELPSFQSAWHQNRNAVSLKNSISSWFSAV